MIREKSGEGSCLAEACRRESCLTPVQTEVLAQLAPCLPFVADLTKAHLRLYVPGKETGEYKIVFEGVPDSSLAPGTLWEVQSSLEALLKETFRSGKSLNQWEESETESHGLRSYAVKDAGGKTIGVVILSYSLTMPIGDFAHLLHGAETILNQGKNLNPAVYGRLSHEDGIMIADSLRRIVFADEIVRHIYHKLGVGSLLGRLYAKELTDAVDEEVLTKKRPWERVMYAGNSIFSERRLDFPAKEFPPSSTRSGVGHIVIMRDITEQKRLEHELNVQSALRERIAELEEELMGIKDSLETRKLVDRAKGILMEAHGLSEEESYRRMQRYAMMKRMTIKAVAEAIVAQASHA